ncbi:MAG: hypothetical protein NW215_07435 [Hyphomicrobiales bacterium]|nr:hypothetical protein [Hyphomicrobiales bacterium]
MDWYRPCSYDAEQKRLFHRAGSRRLKHLAVRLQFAPGHYDLRSNLGGIAVSGEITLHHEANYIQVCQPATRYDTGILIRTCRGRDDFCGGANHFEPLRLLDDLPALAARVRKIIAQAASVSARV